MVDENNSGTIGDVTDLVERFPELRDEMLTAMQTGYSGILGPNARAVVTRIGTMDANGELNKESLATMIEDGIITPDILARLSENMYPSSPATQQDLINALKDGRINDEQVREVLNIPEGQEWLYGGVTAADLAKELEEENETYINMVHDTLNIPGALSGILGEVTRESLTQMSPQEVANVIRSNEEAFATVKNRFRGVHGRSESVEDFDAALEGYEDAVASLAALCEHEPHKHHTHNAAQALANSEAEQYAAMKAFLENPEIANERKQEMMVALIEEGFIDLPPGARDQAIAKIMEGDESAISFVTDQVTERTTSENVTGIEKACEIIRDELGKAGVTHGSLDGTPAAPAPANAEHAAARDGGTVSI